MLRVSWAILAVPCLAAAADFARDVLPVLRTRCFACHGAAQQQSGLRLDRRDDALRGGYSGAVIRPGASSDSKLVQLVAAAKMPPQGPALPAKDIAAIREWIDAGAPWTVETASAAKPARPKPWSFAPLRKPAVPPVKGAAWTRNPIDAFILARLEKENIAPSPEAARHTLVRRLYLDLTGLPPSPEEAAEFIAGGSYERLVERLLESPHFGEKWARQWLDLVRYADSEGGVQDYPRPFAWRYRDWVIDAFNRDMPFDRFAIEQIAGDLLPGARLDQKIATGFHRQTVTSREGGIDLARLRFDQLVDRTNTTGVVWFGLTVGCAQCHDHKYDPITQKDYYRLLAFFENTAELDLEAPLPGELGVYRGYVAQYRAERQKLIDEYKIMPYETDWEANLRDAAANPGKRPNWDVGYDAMTKLVDYGHRILHTPVEKRGMREQDALVDHFVKYASKALLKKGAEDLKLKELDEKLQALHKKYPDLSTVMIVKEDEQRSPTYVRLRGDFKNPGIEVKPGAPESLTAAATPDRLALARWIVSPENPLTARVTMNRLWQELFGRGLVRTSEDFGMQGEKPAHPELLDWLASEFRDRGWSTKHMVRLMVTSDAYKRSSDARPDLLTRDPSNTLLARQSRFRLPAELIRDAALRSGGILMETVGGESVRPPQPEGVTDLQYSMKWEETAGRAKYRRGLYIQIQRTAAYPLLMNFDAPDRVTSCTRRESSNTPLQPLNLLNDPVFVEAAQALTARVLREPAAARADLAFEICYSRKPSPKERDLLLSHVERRRELARANPKSAQTMPTADLPGVDPAEAVAWFGASRALLNSDEFLTRE